MAPALQGRSGEVSVPDAKKEKGQPAKRLYNPVQPRGVDPLLVRTIARATRKLIAGERRLPALAARLGVVHLLDGGT